MTQYLIVGAPELSRSELKKRLGELLLTAYDLEQILDWPADPAPVSTLALLKALDEGIDLSHYQDMDIVWEAVAAAKKFAILKATEGLATDTEFALHFRDSFNRIRRGVYCFYRIDMRKPKEQALAFVAAVRKTGLEPDMGPGVASWWVDFEGPVNAAGAAIDLAPFKPYIMDDLLTFLNTLEDEGLGQKDVGIYTRRSFFNLWLPQPVTSTIALQAVNIASRDLWVAGYPFTWPNPAYKPGIPWPWELTLPNMPKPALLHQYDNGAMTWSQVVPGTYIKKIDKSYIIRTRSEA